MCSTTVSDLTTASFLILRSLHVLGQAHEAGVRNIVFTHNENWLVTSDAAGQVKYWKLNLELVKVCLTVELHELPACAWADLEMCRILWHLDVIDRAVSHLYVPLATSLYTLKMRQRQPTCGCDT